ncbi:tail fibers protein [Vibrio phage VP-HS15]|uniref:Tail fibers protein n=1 Tax=Vibrio phage VP-HS15 TaxID=2686284 RepID=A0A6B9LQA0_9CAUD|nr:tail fibers protein [Vibrio phage VP-HS15]
MGRITGSWERPIQGVSQQADKDRIDGQCTKQENLTPSPLYGLMKRVGTRHVKKILETSDPNSLWYQYDRGGSERYLILVEPNEYPRVFDLEGNEKVVNVNIVSDDYLKVSNPKKALRMKTIADYTFIANTNVVTETLPDKTPTNPSMAIVYCQYATYGRDYQILIDGNKVASLTTPDGSVASHIDKVRTNYISEQLSNQINGKEKTTETVSVKRRTVSGGSGTTQEYYVTVSSSVSVVVSLYNKSTGSNTTAISVSGSEIVLASGNNKDNRIEVVYEAVGAPDSKYTSEVHGNTLFIERIDGTSFSISTVDSANGDDLIAIQDKVRQLSNLPPYAPEGYIVKVQNNEGFEANSYWLKAVPNDDTDQSGSSVRWVESTAQDTLYKFNLGTMPHQLVSLADGTFELSYGEWEERKVGDDTTNPFPSFVGGTIQSIGTFQNRMLFTSGESVIFGKTNEFFNFFRETTQEESSDDPIDVFADADQVNNLLHHAILEGDIVFFAENGQFLIDGSKPITKDSLVFRQVTSYPMNTDAQPAVTGESIMFSFIAGKYAGLREMFTDSLTDTKRARPITEHVAEYIEGVPIDLIASPNINLLLVRTDINNHTIYAYNWLWSGEQRVQAAFHKWIFDGDVLFAKFVSDKVYFVIDRGNGVYLEQMPISNDADDDGLTFPVSLDQRAVVNANWTGTRWEWTNPYEVEDTDMLEFVRGTGCWDSDKGTTVIFETDGNTYWSYDDLADVTSGVTSCNLTAGTKYTSRFVPTQPSIKDQSGRVMGLDRFTLGKVTLNYESIGNITVYVYDLYSESRQWKYEYNGRRLGSWNNRVGFSPLAEGQFSFPVRLQAQQAQFEIVTDDYRPFILRDMEWEGMFKQRGRRI